MPTQKSDFRELKKGKKEEKHKVIILSGFSDTQLNKFIDLYKKNNLPKAIFATITKINKNFKLKDLLRELKKEHKAIKNFPSKNN